MLTVKYPVSEFGIKSWLIALRININNAQIEKIYKIIRNLDQPTGVFLTLSYNKDKTISVIDTATSAVIKKITL